MSLLLIVSALGATGLITRAITQDDIGAPLRNAWRTVWIWILGPRNRAILPPRSDGSRPTGWLWKYIGCHRCVGVLASAAVFGLGWKYCGEVWYQRGTLVLAAAFAVSLLLDAVKS